MTSQTPPIDKELNPHHVMLLAGDERRFYDSVVHGLRSRGWSRLEAEGEALDRLEALRARAAHNDR